jgi:queuine tRNA-ribosyltransferase
MTDRYPNFKFDILPGTYPQYARLGRLHTPHGIVETPAFIFCATKAAIKGCTVDHLRAAHTQIILSNTYHLMVQPGAETVAKLGGLQKMTGWHGPMFTDSGGFQIFSLGHGSVAEEIKGRRQGTRAKSVRNITEEGATFKSYLDGSNHILTPEISIDVQRKLGADLIVVLDECTPFHVDKDYTAESMRRSHRWGDRSLAEFDRGNDGSQSLYGIIQGGVYPDLRAESVDYVNSRDFFAHAVGGSLGANKEQMYEVVAMTMSRLSRDRPVHLLGIGGIEDIFVGVRHGIDTFDCVHPTRLARHGGALVKRHTKEHVHLTNAKYRQDTAPIADDCLCMTCQHYSRGYIHHLLKAKEMLALQLITIHNIFFMNDLMASIRRALANGTLDAEEKKWLMK